METTKTLLIQHQAYYFYFYFR